MYDNKNEEKSLFGEIEEIEDPVEKMFKQFKNFDIYPYPPYDHYFINHKTKQINPQSTLAKTILKEWEILEKDLPSWIFVRAYGGRIDLMRAVIVGLEGTPYCHGLFFFDIFFPSSFPANPPAIFYRSYGVDLNPHFPQDGRVSHDFLNANTSHCCNYYKSNPQQSNIMQLLVSIQQQVLNANPYYSEEGQAQKSNKEVFALNCKAMLSILAFPPMHFRYLVEGHFRKRAHPILQIYKAEMKPDDDEAINQLFLKLVKAFEENGAYCGHHHTRALKHVVMRDPREESSLPPAQEEKGYSYGSSILKFLNKIKNKLEL